MAPPSRLPISAPVPASHSQSFVGPRAPWTSVDDPADGASLQHPVPVPTSLCACSAPAPAQSTGCCRLAAVLRANPWSVGGWIVLRAISSLARLCTGAAAALVKAVRQILGGFGGLGPAIFRAHPGTATAPIVAALHLTCATAPQHSPLPRVCLQQFLGLCQPQDPFNWPACSH